jgi:hypothetical protein
MSSRLVRRLGSPLAILALVGTLAFVQGTAGASASQTAPTAKPKSTSGVFYVTLYGFVDNSPPSAIISNPQIHQTAGGTGTFSDPVTFATDIHEEKPGTIVYYGFLKKYFIMEDTCTECSKDFNTKAGNGDNPVPPRAGHRWRIDMWAGGDKRSLKDPDKTALLDCENALTQNNGGTVIVNPPSNEPVDTTPIYNANTRQCFTP